MVIEYSECVICELKKLVVKIYGSPEKEANQNPQYKNYKLFLS